MKKIRFTEDRRLPDNTIILAGEVAEFAAADADAYVNNQVAEHVPPPKPTKEEPK